MSSLLKLKLAWIVSASTFWVAIIVLYFNSKGFTSSEVYKLTGMYYLFMVLLEYPTGVIGDFFTHKLSVTLGFLFCFLAMVVGIPVYENNFIYYILFFVLAFGQTLISGSNEALLYKLSNNFKKDLVNIISAVQIYSLIAISIGGFIGSINILYPIYLTSLGYLIAFFLMLGVKDKKSKYVSKKVDANIFKFAYDGLISLIMDRKLLGLLGLILPIGVFQLSFKWIYNPYLEYLNIPISYWGIFIGLFSVTLVLGTLFYKKVKRFNFFFYGFLLLLFTITSFFMNIFYLSLLSFGLVHFIIKIIDTHLVIKINEKVKDEMRASMASLRSLIFRLLASGYMLFISFTLEKFNISYLFIFTAIIILIMWIPGSLLVFRKKR